MLFWFLSLSSSVSRSVSRWIRSISSGAELSSAPSPPELAGMTGQPCGPTWVSGLAPLTAPSSAISLTRSAQLAAREPLASPPGTQFDYGGANLQFLGAAAEQVTSQRQAASFSRFSQSGVVQMSFAWADTLHGIPRMIAA